MSDKYQPNQVVESQLELEDMASPELADADSGATEPNPSAEIVIEDAVSEDADADAVEASADAPVEADGVTPPDSESETEEKEKDSASSDAKASYVNISALDAPKSSIGERVGGMIAPIGAFFKGRGWLAGGMIVVLLVAFLFLPPVSLAQRITSGGGFDVLTAENPTLEHADGINVAIDPQAEGKLRVKLSAIPEADFTLEVSDAETLAAVEAIPQHLEPQSPYYNLEVRGQESGPATLQVDVPNGAEPWETLDLYTWDGEGWRWIPSQLDPTGNDGNGALTTEVEVLPSSLIVMQTRLVQQKIIAEVSNLPLNGAESVLTEADVPGLLIGTLGGVNGDVSKLAAAGQGQSFDVAPLVRNWAPERDPNWALVQDMLSSEADSVKHIENLITLTQANNHSGVVLDYRAVQVEDRAAYAEFVQALAAEFHTQNLWLGVIVDTPQQVGGEFDSGGYDWQALGEAVDQLRVVMPLDPQAYVAGGEAEQLLAWGTTQVDRYKLLPIYSTLSTDGQKLITLNEVLSPLAEIQSTQTLTDSVEPGEDLGFTLGEALMVESDASGATQVRVGKTALWLGTPQWLHARMNLSSRFNLGGVVLRDLEDLGNAPNLVAAIADYQAQIEGAAYPLPQIIWEVTAPDGKAMQISAPLTETQLAWTSPEVTGTYKIAAQVSGLDKGSLELTVASAVVLTDTETTDGDVIAAGTTTGPLGQEGEPETADDTLAAAFVADVTIPDNTHFDKGEAFVKTWRLKNSGAQEWPAATVLHFTNGDQMGASAEVEVGKVSSGETVDISVDMVAPDADGSFKGVWSLMSDGKAVAGGGVMVLIKAGEEPEPTPAPTAPTTPPTGPVTPVSGGSFELGGHVRDMGMPYAEKMHYSGMTWAKVQIRYGEGGTDMINAAAANGFKIQLSALGAPSMVTEPGFEQNYANWVAGLAAAGAQAIEIWNEPNIDREWQIGYISPQAYTNLLCAAYTAIKAANPSTAVISAAPAPTGFFGGCGPNGCDDQYWMEGLYNAGAANCMDYIGAHHNAGATAPSARSGHPTGSPHHSWYFLPQTELYYNIFRGTRQLFYTEMGYASQEGVSTFSDGFAWARGINNAQQAAWLAEAASLGSSSGMVRCIIVWNIDFSRYGTDPQDGFAIIRPGGGCAACESLHSVLGTR